MKCNLSKEGQRALLSVHNGNLLCVIEFSTISKKVLEELVESRFLDTKKSNLDTSPSVIVLSTSGTKEAWRLESRRL